MLVKNNFKGKTFQLLKHLCKKQLQGGSILTAEMLGSILILIAEMLAKTISRGKRSNCWNAGRKQFQGGSILIAEMLVKKISRGKRSNCWKIGKKPFQGGSIQLMKCW